jgi:hypothetical protein
MKHCQQCKKDFATPSSHRRHMTAKHADTISTAVRPDHRCLSCDARFARNETLQRHIRSKHTLELMVRCQFCLENFRKDYFARHESRCAIRYWAKVCRNSELINEIQDGQCTEINWRPLVRRDMYPDAQLIPATGSILRVVHEIDINVRLASEAFNVAFRHYQKTGNIESCLEAISTSLCLSIPIEPDQCGFRLFDPFVNLYFLAQYIGEYVRGEEEHINAADDKGSLLMHYACIAGAAELIEPLFWRGAEFGSKSLLYAVRSGSFDTVRFCLTLGADPNDFMVDWDDWGNSPLTLASASPEKSHIASLLIEYGAAVSVANDYGMTPLHLAAKRADVDLLRVLLAKDSSSEFLDDTNDEEQHAVDAAIEGASCGVAEDQALEFVSALLDAGAEANGTDYKHSAMTVAVYFDCGAILRLLLNREPESPRKTEYLNEALAEAVIEDAMDAFEILVKAGASVDDEMLRMVLEYRSLEKLELFFKAGALADFVEDETLELLFGAARDQQGHGAEGWVNSTWADAVGKCKLLCLYFPDDRRLRRFMDALEFEVENFR